METKKFEWRENLLLVLLVTIGVLLIGLQRVFEHDFGHAIASTIGGLGEALLIAGLLAFIVDRGIKNRLARDALSYMVGWEVPDSLREAIREIVRLPCMRRGFVVTYSIEKCDVPGFVCLTSQTQFAVHNLTRRKQSYQYRSRVESLKFAELVKQGKSNATVYMKTGISATDWDNDPLPEAKDDGDSIERSRTVDITANGECWFRTERVQYYPENFFAVLDLLAPACEGITVRVQTKRAFRVAVHFGGEGEVTEDKSKNEWTHAGVLLPGQHVRLSWAPIGDAAPAS